jgi:hypothetical protein
MLRMTMRWFVCAAALAAALAGGLLLLAGGAQAETQCATRPAVGGGTITTCREVGRRPGAGIPDATAIGGGTTTTGAGRVCRTRSAVGGGAVTSCR